MASESGIRVVVHGAAGKVGREVVAAVSAAERFHLAATVDLAEPQALVGAPHYRNVADALNEHPADVVVDFTNAAASMGMAPAALGAGARLVIGSTGFSEEQLRRLEGLVGEHRLSAVLAPNFTIGAVLLMQLASMAAHYFEYVEVVEEHHETKIDAPSGTALALARAIHEGRSDGFRRNVPEREPLAGTRGADYEDISIHSVRMPGKMANHQVTFGGQGQTLTLRHDTINRECYLPGVLMAAERVMKLDGLVIGLDKVMAA